MDYRIFSPRFNLALIIGILLLILALLCGCGPQYKYSFERAIDGDTIVVSCVGDTNKRIRLYGVNSPELPEKGGMEAKYFVEDIMSEKVLRLDVKYRDRYDRTVAIVYVKGWHEPLNLILLQEGHATISERYCTESICEDWRKNS